MWVGEEEARKVKEVSMVAISLYRGNLHRVADVPRQWLMPNPKISLKDFKSLLHRRSKALSRLNATTCSIPNPNPNPLSNGSQAQPPKVSPNHGEGPSATAHQPEDDHRIEAQLVAVSSAKKPVDGSHSKHDALERKTSDAVATSKEKQTEPVADNVDLFNEKEKRKKEVEDKLEVLNVKKHNLVLVLKEILNAEEELKRRSMANMQGVAMRAPSIPLQGEGMNDTGSMTRHMAQSLGSEGNLRGDVDGGEGDDFANHTMHSRHVLRPSSMSPSSESPLRRTPSVQQNVQFFM
ncbi:uncharacterized protein LOC113852454 isoform X2 [Abrus precatorius]|uniref:Uncharacterized protein LOC113852454 isoform X2 n=1 Tax=Abrus precatorius TaxID=3816 RepID=A0A8B8K5G9_ABRPR|nr:uncharacterized protein LOC113852454 isoform X2 [Abrus precatorius]